MSRDNVATTRRKFLAASGMAVASTTMSKVTLAYSHNNTKTTVTIKRDSHGVPHVYARDGDSPAPVLYGYGYAAAEDRLFQLEMYRRFYSGTVAEVLGSDWVNFDRAARHNRSSSVSLSDQISSLDDKYRTALCAFANGINQYIHSIKSGNLNRDFHKGFHDNDFRPGKWDQVDVAGMFVASMSFFSDYQAETLDAALLDLLREKYDEAKAKAILSDVNWGEDPGAPTSIIESSKGYTPSFTPAGNRYTITDHENDPGEHNNSNHEKSRRDKQPLNGPPSGEFRIPTDSIAAHDSQMAYYRTLASGLDSLGLPIKVGSNALTVAGDHTESGDAILYGGPQMEFSSPSVMYETGLHGPNFDVSGITVAGYPFVMFGRNRTGAFTSTAGIDNSIQLFVETIRTRENRPDQYKFRGEWRDIKSHTETIPVADGPDKSVVIRRTHHGVISHWEPTNNEALSKARSYEGRDMEAFEAYYDAQFASDAHEFVDAAQQCTYSLNFLWAGQDGDIAYAHLGRYPDNEAVPWDTRFPANGTKHELSEENYLSAADGEVPASVNPSVGFAAQWNNKPAPGWNNGDMSYAWGTDNRVQRIINNVRERIRSRSVISSDEIRKLITDIETDIASDYSSSGGRIDVSDIDNVIEDIETSIDKFGTTGVVSYSDLKEIVYDIAFVDLRAIRYKQPLLDALKNADLSDREQAARQELRNWNNYRQGDGSKYLGKYPVGYTIFNEFFPRLLKKTFQPVLGEEGYKKAKGILNYRYGRPLLLRLLHADEVALKPATDYFNNNRNGVFREAFHETVESLQKKYGKNVQHWKASSEVDNLDNMALFGMPIGVGDAGKMPFLNRGTENHFVRVGIPAGYKDSGDLPYFPSENILPPGNSAYIAPDGTADEHYADQLDDFIAFHYKRLRFTDAAVTHDQRSTNTLSHEK